MFDAFIKVIPNFYSCKANVESAIVCFDGIAEYLEIIEIASNVQACFRRPNGQA